MNDLALATTVEKIESLVDRIERGYLARDLRTIWTAVEELRKELSEPRNCLVALEAGALQALIVALPTSSPQLLESVLSAILAFDSRPVLSNGSSVSIGLLLRLHGLTELVKAPERIVDARASLRIRELTLRILKNVSSDEAGSRLVVHARGCSFAIDCLKRYSGERNCVLLSLSTLSYLCMFQLTARAAILTELSVLTTVGRQYKQEPEVVEYILSILSLVSTARAGANVLLSMPSEAAATPSSANNLPPTCSVEAASLAAYALGMFAVRTYSKGTGEDGSSLSSASTSNPGVMDSPINVLKSLGGRLSIVSPGPGSNVPAVPSAAPVISVVTGHERRSCGWAVMLLNNLATHSNKDINVRREILSVLQHFGQKGSDKPSTIRELHARALDRVKVAVAEEMSENNQEQSALHEEEVWSDIAGRGDIDDFVEMISWSREDDYSDGIGLALLMNLEYANVARAEAGATASQILKAVVTRLVLNVSSLTTSTSLTPMPLSSSSSRLLSFLFTFLSHPYARERLSTPDFENVANSLVPILRNADPPEFFRHINKGIELALGNRDSRLPLLPYRSLPLIVIAGAPSQSTSGAVPLTSPSLSNPGGTPSTPARPSRSPQLTPMKQIPGQILSVSASGGLNASMMMTPGSAQKSMIGSAKEHEDIPDGSTLFEWRLAPRELCKQITQRMERLYGVVNPSMLIASAPYHSQAVENSHTSEDVLKTRVLDEPAERFLRFHSALVTLFKRGILSRTDAKDRAAVIESLIAVASFAAQQKLSNIDLTMACLEALGAPSVTRLEITWRKISPESLRTLRDLRHLSSIDDVPESGGWSSVPLPGLLRNPAIPYLKGCLDSLRQIEKDFALRPLKDAILARYDCLNLWLPYLSRARDWHPFSHMFPVVPAAQMIFSSLIKTTLTVTAFNLGDEIETNGNGGASPKSLSGAPTNRSLRDEEQQDESDLGQFSLLLEPKWALDQADSEDAVRVHMLVSKLLLALDLFDRRQQPEPSAEQLGGECRIAIKELIAREEFSIDKNKAQKWVISSVERILVKGHLPRLFEMAVAQSREKETELISRCDSLSNLGYERACDVLGVPVDLRQPWRAAILLVRLWSEACLDFLPHQVLNMVIRVKDAIFDEAKANGFKEISADDLLPVIALVVAQAQPRRLSTSCYLLHQFYGDDELASGEAAYYFVTIESAVHLITHLKL